MSSRLKKRHVFYLAVFSLFFIYQNCAQPSDKTDTDSSYESTLPFAYKATVDTIAYMSCSGIDDPDVDSRAYFTFRAGAYNSSTGGMSITKEFADATSFYSGTDRAHAFGASERNSNTLLSFSLREANNYQNPVSVDGAVLPGFQFESFLPPLDSDLISGPLGSVKVGQKVNYFPGEESQRLLEASLRLFKYENVAARVRTDLINRTTYLVAGYSTTADAGETALRSPYDFEDPGSSSQTNAKSVYGTGYLLSFRNPRAFSTAVNRVIHTDGIQEKDLVTGKITTTNFACSEYYQFMIVRPEDITSIPVTCNRNVDTSTDQQRDALNAIRRVLRVEDWFVDMDNYCVVPKTTGDVCYGDAVNKPPTGTAQPIIQYGNCTGTPRVCTCVEAPTVSQPTYCPHFVSVCIRR